MANKAVLIFDMPETCNGCPCMDDEDCDLYCTITSNSLHNRNKRPDWCPLIEVTKGDITRARMYLNRLEYAKENRL